MIELLIKMYLEYVEEIKQGGDIPPPPIEHQKMFKEINEEDFLYIGKSTMGLKELNEFKANPDSIPQSLTAYTEELDLAVLGITYFVAKYGKGKFYDKLDLMIKLIAKPYDVEKQINLTEASR